MPDYYYDGSFDGLLTLIYKAYEDRHNLEKVHVEPEQGSLNFGNSSDVHISTDFLKARRVEKSICKKISSRFLKDIRICFLSCNENKDTAITHTTYKALKHGEGILDSVDELAFLMKKLIRQVLKERHRYTGLTRFREMEDGTLFATIEPKNNVLPILLPHFKGRLKNEKFAIFDKSRGMAAYYNKEGVELFFIKDIEVKWSSEEKEYAALWNIFHKSISIKERKNRKLQQSNMPKYYWKHLIEEIE